MTMITLHFIGGYYFFSPRKSKIDLNPTDELQFSECLYTCKRQALFITHYCYIKADC